VDEHHSFQGKSFLDIYESYLHPWRYRPVCLLEIGVLDGNSIRTWKDYFPKGEICGLDIDPACKSNEEGRISIAIGSQDDAELLESAFPGVDFDVIVDDGSHINTFTIASFQFLFHNRLVPGGFYIIEDLACTYDQLQSNHQILDWWPGMQYNDPSKTYDNDRSLMDTFFNSLIRDLDHRAGDIEYIHFWAQTCVIKKRRF
jgi:hypothetical protein